MAGNMKEREEKKENRTETGNGCRVTVGNMKERDGFDALCGKVGIIPK